MKQKSLLPSFLCIGNGLPGSIATVQYGNERVLKARLSDAEFFVSSDKSIRTISRLEKLGHVTFLLTGTDAQSRRVESAIALKKISSIWPIYNADFV